MNSTSTQLAELPRREPVRLSASLARHIDGPVSYRDPTGDGIVIAPPPVLQGDVSEARAKLAEATALCRPADPKIIAAWCERLRALPKSPDDQSGTQKATMAIIFACGELPAAVWTTEALAEGLRRWKWWPSPAEVYALLEPIGTPFIRTRDTLRRIAQEAARTPPVPDALPDKSEAAQEHVRAVVGAFVAERKELASKAEGKPQTITPAYLSRAALDIAYRKSGLKGPILPAPNLKLVDPER